MKSDEEQVKKAQSSYTTSRRTLLKNAGLTAVGLTVAPGLLLSRIAEADTHKPGNVPKSAVQYQSTPKGNQQCSNCRFFIPGPKPSAMGHCTIVTGKISPHGWCNAWAKKSS